MSPVELVASRLWWNGPEWLMNAKSEWPKMQLAESPTVMPEMKKEKKQEAETISCVTVQASHP